MITIITAYSARAADRCKGIAALALGMGAVAACALAGLEDHLGWFVGSAGLFFLVIGALLLARHSTDQYLVACRKDHICVMDGRSRSIIRARDIECLLVNNVFVGPSSEPVAGCRSAIVMRDGKTLNLPMRTEDAWRHVRVERAFRDLGIPVVCSEKAS